MIYSFPDEPMWKDKITVMIVPRDHGELRQLSIPVKLLWTAGVLCICFVLVNMFLLADYFDKRVDQARLEKLTRENQILAQRYQEMEQSIGDLSGNYDLLVAKEEAIRTIFDLPEINPEARLLGVGGPSDNIVESMSPEAVAAMEVSGELDGLLRLAEFEQDRYQEVYQLLIEKRDLLDHTPSIMPCKGYFSRGFGNKNDPFTGFKQFHSGLDIANHTGTPIYATAEGKVTSVRKNGGMGKMIVIDHGHGYKTRYGHLDSYKVKVGQTVKRGDEIATMGNTGYSTGPHLHYEIIKNGKAINPYHYILNK